MDGPSVGATAVLCSADARLMLRLRQTWPPSEALSPPFQDSPFKTTPPQHGVDKFNRDPQALAKPGHPATIFVWHGRSCRFLGDSGRHLAGLPTHPNPPTHRTHRRGRMATPAARRPPDIDAATWAALPEDIQRELSAAAAATAGGGGGGGGVVDLLSSDDDATEDEGYKKAAPRPEKGGGKRTVEVEEEEDDDDVMAICFPPRRPAPAPAPAAAAAAAAAPPPPPIPPAASASDPPAKKRQRREGTVYVQVGEEGGGGGGGGGGGCFQMSVTQEAEAEESLKDWARLVSAVEWVGGWVVGWMLGAAACVYM